MKVFKSILLVTGMFLMLLPNVFAQFDCNQKNKMKFLIDLKFNLLFQEKYSNEIHQQLKTTLVKILKGKAERDSLESYNYETTIYQFQKPTYPIDKKILNKLQEYSFADSTLGSDDYYFVLAFEIHQLLEILNGTCCMNALKSRQDCVMDTLSISSFVDKSKMDFHHFSSIILNEFEDAHSSLYSTLTYSFYNPTYASAAMAIKIIGDTSFLMVKTDSPIIYNINSIDTISFFNYTRLKLDTLQKITHRNNATNYLKSKFIDERYNLENKRKGGVFLIQDSIIFIDIQRTSGQSKKHLTHNKKKHDIKLIIFDMRGYTNLAERAYSLLTKAIKIKSKIAVLIDKNTYSLSEILARKLSYDNTTVIGECSAGAMGETNIVRLNRPFSLQYTSHWYKTDAFNDYTLRKICPDKNFKFNLPAGYLLESELKEIVKLIP